MSSELEREREEKASRRDAGALRAIKGGMAIALRSTGRELRGFTYKDRGYDHLIVVKAVWEGQEVVCFVGGDSLTSVLVKAMKLAEQGKLKWRADKFGG